MIEDKIWNLNPNNYIIGSDEVGRGSFAGPIGAASVSCLLYTSDAADE